MGQVCRFLQTFNVQSFHLHWGMDNLARFACRFKDCNYTTSNFNQLLNRCWDKHSLDPGFACKCDVPSCTSKFINIQSLRRHLNSKYLWFHEKYLQRYGRVKNGNVDLDENSENENVISIQIQLDETGVSSGENNESDCENVSFSDFNHEKLVANFLLELREIYGTTTEASCFVSEKVMHILQLGNKIRYSMFTKSIRQNNPDIILDHESELILTCESAFC